MNELTQSSKNNLHAKMHYRIEFGKIRHTSYMSTKFLHTLEMLDSIIANSYILYVLTRTRKDLFDDTLANLQQKIKESNDMPHFRDNDDKNSTLGTNANCTYDTFY